MAELQSSEKDAQPPKAAPGPGKAQADKVMEEGMRLFRLRRWEAALSEFLAVKTSPASPGENAELAYYLGLCYTKLERYDDALLYLEQVVTASDDTLRICQCRLSLAYIYVITRRAKLAEFELDRLIAGGFESPQIFTTLAYAAWSQRAYAKAVEYYERALELDEYNATAMNGLGYVLGRPVASRKQLCALRLAEA